MHTIIMANYHRIGVVDPANPFHRLHTVPTDEFTRQLDYMQSHGKIVSLADVRDCHQLADINYLVSFDDVPLAATAGIDILLQRDLPVTLSVCARLASDGSGTRDKVYCIEKYIPQAALQTATQKWLDQQGRSDIAGESFYHVTKRDDLDPHVVEAELIDPLFRAVEHRAHEWFARPAYQDWESLRLLARNPLVTLASHGSSHANLAAMSRRLLAEDVIRAHHLFVEMLDYAPRYFALPFGRYDQRLATDCVEILHNLDYQGLLWVGDTSNIVSAPYCTQMLQLTRLHAPTTLEDFLARDERCRSQRLEAVVWQERRRAHQEHVTITESSDSNRSVLHEMVIRQGKDYASDPGYYHYQFTANPSKGERPDYYAAESSGRIEATAYNFHTTFSVEGVHVPGVYLSGWRRMPRAQSASAGRLLQKMLAREPIVGVYRPSREAATAFTTWQKVAVWRLRIPLDRKDPGTVAVKTAPAFDDRLEPLAQATTLEAGFTVTRSKAYYDWRHGTYPLAPSTYITLGTEERSRAYAVLHQRGHRVSIADWYARDEGDYLELIRHAIFLSRLTQATTLEVETSRGALANLIRETFPGQSTTFYNYYHLNLARLSDLGLRNVAERWQTFAFHESATTSDILIR